MSTVKSGDQFDAQVVIDALNDLRTKVNAVPEYRIADKALTERHLSQALIVPTNHWDENITKVGQHLTDITVENYTSRLVDAGGADALPFDFQRFGTLGINPPYGAPPAADTGWRIPAINQASGGLIDAAVVSLNAATNLTTARIPFVKLRGYVCLRDRSGTTTQPERYRQTLVLGFGVKDGSGNRYVFEESIRGWSLDAVMRGPVSHTWIMGRDTHLAKPIGLGTLDGTVLEFFMVMAEQQRITPSGPADLGNPGITTFSFSAIPLHTGSL